MPRPATINCRKGRHRQMFSCEKYLNDFECEKVKPICIGQVYGAGMSLFPGVDKGVYLPSIILTEMFVGIEEDSNYSSSLNLSCVVSSACQLP
ncbi:hypothetical protein EVAR_68620_1 [Eumeta japonica]|uniref:Uncharacterized protein n=1 Tax=Eumeta variegata TaxID=151549 RepID=A0A4C2AA51_EUMVA|nr:hypothetical protein EVAR_68620_1 [Eumeta japonica]